MSIKLTFRALALRQSEMIFFNMSTLQLALAAKLNRNHLAQNLLFK